MMSCSGPLNVLIKCAFECLTNIEIDKCYWKEVRLNIICFLAVRDANPGPAPVSTYSFGRFSSLR